MTNSHSSALSTGDIVRLGSLIFKYMGQVYRNELDYICLKICFDKYNWSHQDLNVMTMLLIADEKHLIYIRSDKYNLLFSEPPRDHEEYYKRFKELLDY